MRILVVEDETRLAELLRRGLTEEGHAVDLAASAEEALDWLAVAPEEHDLLLLDLMLPGMSGLQLCREVRRRRLPLPILMLTARDAVADRVAGLDAGADDYLVKPFAFAELAARVRALGRRPPEPLSPVLTAGDLRLDPATHRVWRGEAEVRLGAKEFQILALLLRHPGRVLTRRMIAEHVWDGEFANATNVIDVHIRALRRKLGESPGEGVIETVRGVGYRIAAPR